MDLRIVLGAVAFAALAGSASAGTVVIADASFESPNLNGGYEYGVQSGAQVSSDGHNLVAPTGTSFSAGAGIQSNGDAWGFANAPSGNQTAFLQSYDNQTPGTITQDVTGLKLGQSYYVTLDLSNRPGFGVDPVTIEFLSDAPGATPQDLGTYTPTGSTWELVTTKPAFTATDTSGTLIYSVAQLSGDNDIGLDDVSIAVPEPMTWALFLAGIAMAGGWLRSRRTLEGAGGSALA